MKMANNIAVIRASGVLHNLHVKWQASDSEEDSADARANVQEEQSGHFENRSDSSASSDSGDNEGAAGPGVANPNDAPIQASGPALSRQQVKELGKRHRDMIMDFVS